MKRTCENGVLDFDMMNAFDPRGGGPVCQFGVSAYGEDSCDGPSVQTDDVGHIRLRDLGFKMLCDLCARCGLDSVRYLLTDVGPIEPLSGICPAGKALQDEGIRQVSLPSLLHVSRFNLRVLREHDMMGELAGLSGTDAYAADLWKLLDAFVYAPSGEGTLLYMLDGLQAAMSSMPADTLRQFCVAFYGMLREADARPYSGASTKPVVQVAYMPVQAPMAAPVPDAAADTSTEQSGEAASGFDAFDGGTAEADGADAGEAQDDGNGTLAGAVSDGQDAHEEPSGPEGLDGEGADGTEPADESEAGGEEPGGQDGTEEAGDGSADDGTGAGASDGIYRSAAEDDPGQGSDGDGQPDAQDGDTEPDNGGAEGEGADRQDTGDRGAEERQEEEPPVQEKAPEPELPPVQSRVNPMPVSALVGTDETYASDYLSDQYDKQLEQADATGYLDAMVASRANGTASPIDVLSEAVKKAADTSTPSETRGLREKVGEMAREAGTASGLTE